MHGGLYFSFSQKSVFLKHPLAEASARPENGGKKHEVSFQARALTTLFLHGSLAQRKNCPVGVWMLNLLDYGSLALPI